MSNPWKELLGLLPSDAMKIGQVQAVGADGTATVALVGGGAITATGSGYSPGQAVFVKGGIIRGQAPTLAAVDIQV